MNIRPAAVADMFYPGDPVVLQHDIQQYLQDTHDMGTTPKALIVPHAGYIYSGPVAAQAYAQLRRRRHHIRRVVLLGPCHRVPLEGLAVPGVDAFQTPFGNIMLDQDAIRSILALPQVQTFDLTHEQEHSLEVQIPFLQETLVDFTLVPIVVGDATAAEVSEVLEALWGGDETLIVISSDLSHFHDYDEAKRLDSATCNAIERFDKAAIGHHDACGSTPVCGLLDIASKHHMTVTTLDLRNSGDTAGSKDRVVGYGAWMFEEP